MHPVQAFGVQVDAANIGTPAFEAAIMQVLEAPKYRQAAKVVSVRLRARKRTPVQEAAGEAYNVATNPVVFVCILREPGVCWPAHADWIEHVLETGGEAYMRTPEDELCMLVRRSIDTYGFVLCCLGVLLYIVWRAVCGAVASCIKRVHASKGKLE